jgi:hypothetical protein
MLDPIRDPSASVWQSTTDKVAVRHKMVALAVNTACADLAYNLAFAKVFGSVDDVTRLQNEFNFGQCDPFWSECVVEYVEHYKFAPQVIPYRAGIDNVLDPLPSSCKIALFGDWGTGTQEAINVLNAIKEHEPDVLLHLGDIYYSGTQVECFERFVGVIMSSYAKTRCPRVLSLCGNHDVYSGGEGYYWLVDQLHQGASYFALGNDDWLLIAGDTGKNDYQIPAQETYLERAEKLWIRGKVAEAKAKAKKVILFTHHPLFSRYEPTPVGAVNHNLGGQIDFVRQLSAWFWAHEHRLAVYGPYLGLQRGRCIGHGAVPVLAAGSDTVRFPEVPVVDVAEPVDVDGYMRHGYAILTLNGYVADVSYYAVGSAAAVWQESF